MDQGATAIKAVTDADQMQPALSVTLDIAATLSALLWPLAILVILLAYREKIPALIAAISGRITKLAFPGVTLEFAQAKEFAPTWSGEFDLRHQASAIQVNDSTAGNFVTQLQDKSPGDYALVDLGAGEEWLTSRLYILAIIYARMKGLRCFVFTDTLGTARNRYVGWAQPDKIRWALARRYPWLENAYADAYSHVIRNYSVVSPTGRLGNLQLQDDPQAGIELLRMFLQRIQAPPGPNPTGLADWISLDGNAYEHAAWLDGMTIKEIRHSDLNSPYVSRDELQEKSTDSQMRTVLGVPGHYVAITSAEHRFDGLIDRSRLLERVAEGVAAG